MKIQTYQIEWNSPQSRGHLVADLDPLGITTSAPQEIGGTKRRANENVTRKYFNFGKDYIHMSSPFCSSF